jgi:hypothetical protein
MPVAEKAELRRGQADRLAYTVDDDKVVAQAVHFCKPEFHRFLPDQISAMI